MKVLDLFSGLGGWSQAFKDRGHMVVSVDNQAKFGPTICKDINELNYDDLNDYGHFDVILASPPCEAFSVMAISKHWSKDGFPNKEARQAIRNVLHTLDLIEDLKPAYWIIENPMGMLRRIIGNPVCSITQCQYGNPYMKKTDLWGVLPKSFEPKCCKNGASCHPRTPRGSKLSGIQSLKTPEERAKIPYSLSLAICEACERELKVIVR